MRLRILLVPVVASVALLLAGCNLVNPGGTPSPASNGVEAEEPDQILAKATQALADASSVRAAGTIGEGMLGVTLDLTYSGDDVTGTANVLGVVANVLKVGNDLYVKADISLFEQLLGPEHQDDFDLFGDKWIKLDLSLVEMLVPIPFGVTDLVSTTAPLTKGEVTTVGETPAITLTDAAGATLHVATVGEPYLLDLTAEGDRNLTFSQFGAEVLIEAPPADEVLDPLGSLGQS
jgi:hypothetical protein